MVGASTSRIGSWADVYDDRQQDFIRQLRLLYQRSLRTQAAARTRETPATTMPLALNGSPIPHLIPRGWGATAAAPPAVVNAAAAAAAAATTPVTAAANAPAAAADADDPCPAVQQQQQQQNQPANRAVGAGAGTGAAVVGQQQHMQQPQQQQQQEGEEDDSDDEPPGMMDTSGGEDDGDEDDEEDDYGDDDEEAGDNDDGNAYYTPSPFARTAPATTAIMHAWNRAGRRVAAPPAAGRVQRQRQLGFSRAVPLLAPERRRRPASCSFLQRGVAFEGSQQLTTHMDVRRHSESWTVAVVIQDVDLATGYVAGTMQARNVPGVPEPIETFWEGCIVDDVNHTFYTRAWGASRETDLQHWAKFDGWSAIKSAVVQHSGRCGQLERHPVIYMRWKEQFFVHSGQQDCGLTIAGFYYVALHRKTGQLQGFYYDPHSSPFQELNMHVCGGSSSSGSCTNCSSSSSAGSSRNRGDCGAGMSFGSYGFA